LYFFPNSLSFVLVFKQLFMIRRFVVILFLGACFCGLPFLMSCGKDALVEGKQDTVLVARIFQPDSLAGKDAVVESILPDMNFGDSSFLSVFAWTNDGLFNNARSLLKFDLSSISSVVKIKKATLSLYWISYENLREQTGENAFSIYRITSAWAEHSVTWNNQPDTTALHKVLVPQSTLTDQSYINMDVTELVQDMIDNPSASFGLMCILDDEFPYKLVVFASSNHAESRKRPKLIVYFNY
jgi:hypothetical protein